MRWTTESVASLVQGCRRRLLRWGCFGTLLRMVVALSLVWFAGFLASSARSLLASSSADCTWLEHFGGLAFSNLNEPVDTLDEAKARCKTMETCTGVTLTVRGGVKSYFLRDGRYNFKERHAVSEDDLISFLKSCSDSASPDQPKHSAAERRSPQSLAGGLRGWDLHGAHSASGGGGGDEVGQDQSVGDYPFPRDITIPEKSGNGIIYVLYWKETKSGCTWQGLSQICATEDNKVQGFEFIPGATTAQMCESACCEKRGIDKMHGKEKCAMFQFKQDIGCYHGKSKSDCRKWKSASKASSRGWFGGEVNSPQMESQLRHTRDSRFQEMIKSVQSIRELMPQGKKGPYGYGVSIVSPAHYVAALEQSKLDQLKELDIDIQVVDIPDSLEPDFHSSWFFRTIALPSSPYVKTLQLDSDTILCRSLDGQELWKLLDRYDYAATHAPSLFHDAVNPGEPQSRAMVQYNDAVIAYRWNARTREALARAMESAIALPAFGLRDQAAYREAVWNTYSLHDYGLPPVSTVPLGHAALQQYNLRSS
eukprot:INCI9209.1.p1 GENE.INCI9209.1~~INCI9209.1.p1  ORF type:complete len:537 (+),score=64.37 INCI9209.1:197-1807(+)